MKTLTDRELRELDQWLYRNVPGLKTCNCVNWIQHKFGQAEYPEIRRTFLAQGSKDRWPETEPDLPCGHQSAFHSDPADAFQVLEKCFERMGGTLIGVAKVGNSCCVCVPAYAQDFGNVTSAPTLPIAICLFAKALFSK